MNPVLSAVSVSALCAGVWCLALVGHARPTPPAGGAATRTLVSLALRGKAVSYGLSGFEPDFDPIDRVIIAATLHDTRPPPVALSDTMLVLSAYLENFQSDTTPVLPDLLSPDQTATYLSGFMQGKAALVNAAGHTIYRGSLLAEVFFDNSAHIIVDLDRVGAPETAPSLRLKGIVTLSKNLTLSGEIHPTRDLAPREAAALRVPRGRPVPWQAVVRGLAVRLPPMMGTGGASAPRHAAKQTRHAHPTPRPQRRLPAPDLWSALAALGIVLASVALLWRPHGAHRRERQPSG